MPISYNPGVTDRSGEIFADQAGQGFSALAAGLQKRMEEDDRLVQNAKIAESGVKTNPELLQRLGLTESQFKAMSANDKVSSFAGGVAGVVQEQQAMKARSEQRMADAQANMYDQHRQYYAQQDAQDSAVGTALKNYMQTNGPDLKIAGPPQAPQGPPPLPPSLASAAPPALPMLRGYAPQPAPNKADWIDEGDATPGTKLTGPALSMAQRLAASFNTPGLGGGGAIRLRQMIDREMEGDNQVSYSEDPVTHARQAKLGRSFLNTGMNPVYAQPEEMINEDGTPTGLIAIQTSKGLVLKNSPKKFVNQLQPAVDAQTGQVIPGWSLNPNTGHEIDQRSGLEKEMGVKKNSGTIPTPASQAEYDKLAKGTQYIGRDGLKYTKK